MDPPDSAHFWHLYLPHRVGPLMHITYISFMLYIYIAKSVRILSVLKLNFC
jgi:hypothetical protein